MNHAASELGLSTEVAQNLYTHRVNPAVVNLLLTNATFINVLNRLTLYFDEVFAAAYAMHNQQIEKLSNQICCISSKELGFVKNPVVVGLGDTFAGGLVVELARL